MRLVLLSILVVFLLLFGCIAEEGYSEIKKESITKRQIYDIDEDGVWDYAVYTFSPIKIEKKTEIQRIVTISRIQHAVYSSFYDITDIDLLTADEKLNRFSQKKKVDENLCLRNIGLIGVRCPTVESCTYLCKANSGKCREVAEYYPEVIGGSALLYTTSGISVDQMATNTRNLIVELRHAPEEQKNLVLSNIENIKNEIANMNSNPLVSYQEFALCEQSNYGVADLNAAAAIIGNYSQETIGYKYNVLLVIRNTDSSASEKLIGADVEDALSPSTAQSDISSYQRITTEKREKVRWTPSGVTERGYVLHYYFQSTKEPDIVLPMLAVPNVKVRRLDFTMAMPINSVFLLFLGITNNVYFAAGIALGILFALLIFLYTFFVLIIKVIEHKLSGKRFADAVRKAFGRTGIRWKLDLPLAVILLLIGFYVSSYIAPPAPANIVTIFDVAQALIEPVGFMGFAFSVIGVVLLYDGIENLAKIITIERYYGAIVREEKLDYMGNIRRLKEKLEELKKLVEEYSSEEFDVSAEYGIASAISTKRIEMFEKKMTPSNIDAVEEALGKVESALESLKERKAAADENWPKWKATIDALLTEKNEVTTALLMGIPASLRTWALTRYAKEKAAEGVVFEKDILKKKKVTIDALLKEMVKSGHLKGGIVIKSENVVASYMEGDKSPTVHAALLFRLRAYLHSLGKTLALGTPVSFVSVGDKAVFVLMKTMEYECGLFVQRDVFKEAIEKWRTKIKTVTE
ncbi:MAG: hypothetical protein QXT45_00245 [Candidatus Bilamarchaeaceae archaeon]